MTPPSAAAAAPRTVRRPRSAAPARALPAGPGPRRVSGPARPARRVLPAGGIDAPAHSDGGLVLGLLERLAGVHRHRSLDRLLAGRIWIGLVAFALIGIVTLQLGLLKLNAGLGHTLEREAALQRENAALSIENSELAAGNRVEASAGRLGMELVPSGALKFLAVHPHSDAAHAASAMSGHVEAPSSESAQTSESSTASGSSEESTSSATSTGETPSTTSESPSSGTAGSAAATSTAENVAPPVETQQGGALSTSPSTAEGTPTGGAQAGPAE
jgi:hypothetical protein